MKFKGTASLVVVFLILGVYYFFVDLPGEKKKLQQKEIAGKVLPFKNEDVREFSLDKKDQNITLLYVSQDQTEAMSMADKIALLNEGEIVQQGNPKMLYEKPDNIFTAKFLGNPPMNLINIFVEKDENFLSSMDEKHFIPKNFKNKTYLGIRPEDIEISKVGIKCLINDIDYQGADMVLSLKLGF